MLYQAKENAISIIATFVNNVWFQTNINTQTKKVYWKLKGKGKHEPNLEFPEGWKQVSDHQTLHGGAKDTHCYIVWSNTMYCKLTWKYTLVYLPTLTP